MRNRFISVFCFDLFVKTAFKKIRLHHYNSAGLIFDLPTFYGNSTMAISVNLSEVEEYLIEPNQYFTLIKIKLVNGVDLKFLHDADDSKDDQFIAFETRLSKTIIKFNASQRAKEIKRSKTIYESVNGLILAIILLFMLLIIPLAYVFRNVTPPVGYLLPLYSGGFYFVFMVYIGHRKRNR